MASRRDFVRDGVALSALAVNPFGAVLAHPAGANASAAGARDAELLVVVDRAFAHAGLFAAQAAALGHTVLAFEHDAGALWMNELEPRLRRGRLAIAGLTGAAAAFCLETLARTYRAAAVARAEHAAGDAPPLATLLAAAERADAALPPFAHVARAPYPAPAFLTWFIETRS